jgi:hypothetical protein
VEWSGRHSATKGNRGKAEAPKRSEEEQIPPRRKRVSAAQWKELVFTTYLLLKKSLYSLRRSHLVMS